MGGPTTHRQCIGTMATPREAVRRWCHIALRHLLHATALLEAAFAVIMAIAGTSKVQPGWLRIMSATWAKKAPMSGASVAGISTSRME